MGQCAENVLLLQCLHQSALKFIRHQIAALRVRTDLQGVQNLVGRHLAAHGVPERTAVFRRGAASLFLTGRGRRLARQRGVDRLRKLRIQSGLPFQTVNLLAEIYYIGLHLFIGRHILGGQQAIRTTLGIQKSLRRFPRLCPLLAQFQNLAHSKVLLKISIN